MFNLKEYILKKKVNRQKKDLSNKTIVVKPITKVAILNNPESQLSFENLKYVQKALNLHSHQFEIFTFKKKNDHYNELRGIVASKEVFSIFGQIKSPEIKEFLDKQYDLLLDFTQLSNIYEAYLSLHIKANLRVGYYNEEQLYDIMLEVPYGDIKKFADETARYLKIIGLLP